MEKNGQNDNKDEGVSSIAKFSGIAFQMIAVIGIFTYAGYKIDQAQNNTTKWFTAALSLIGVFVSLYIIIKSLKN
ncbi:AtpZ/AtpI family protein [Mucilaginibacter sp.]|uniref:AtpZ/AtpI family protein n=1 Tax=Mucilaginibacter sp. TaxID=1882438 RepID=UPI003D09D1BC